MIIRVIGHPEACRGGVHFAAFSPHFFALIHSNEPPIRGGLFSKSIFKKHIKKLRIQAPAYAFEHRQYFVLGFIMYSNLLNGLLEDWISRIFELTPYISSDKKILSLHQN